MQSAAHKYPPQPVLTLPDRQWPSRQLTYPPIWCSSDLRDGNQALANPMNGHTKLRLFRLLVAMGFKEIEVAFPSASQTDFDFVRQLITEGEVPDDVTLMVITQARGELIERTFDALQGARRAIVHLYNPTAPLWRKVVYGKDKGGILDLAVTAAQQIHQRASRHPETEWVFQYSPETFSATEPEFARDICNAVLDIWQPTPQHKAIINLPATVELSSPNVYADQIEWMHRHLHGRDSVVLSVHPHNDRGCAVAAAELAQLAGAERVEGCLFGNGERTGNVDLVTLAMNLYSQGIDPGLDFSDIDHIRDTVSDCIQLPVHPRHPYAGGLVYTAFSGSHQDAIKKGFAAQDREGPWAVPYLPIDPQDVGRSYEAVIRVNSQSGKGGSAWLLQECHGLQLPRAWQVEFSQTVQQHSDHSGVEVDSHTLWQLFQQQYLSAGRFQLLGSSPALHTGAAAEPLLQFQVQDGEQPLSLNAEGNGPLDALVNALSRHLGCTLDILDFHEHARSEGRAADAVAFVALSVDGQQRLGASIHSDSLQAALRAVFSALNRR